MTVSHVLCGPTSAILLILRFGYGSGRSRIGFGSDKMTSLSGYPSPSCSTLFDAYFNLLVTKKVTMRNCSSHCLSQNVIIVMNDQSPLGYVYMIPQANSLFNYVGAHGVSHRFNGGFVNKCLLIKFILI